ncbi:hypothetical protein FGB62_7g31 [Gracilaria domingensis]|nr:hypothetical protein FGB62_7g31 [Gracilaria domingensis]
MRSATLGALRALTARAPKKDREAVTAGRRESRSDEGHGGQAGGGRGGVEGGVGGGAAVGGGGGGEDDGAKKERWVVGAGATSGVCGRGVTEHLTERAVANRTLTAM